MEKKTSFLVCKTEFDSPELRAVFEWLKSKGWSAKEKSWDIVGSQEITVYELSNGHIKADLVLETYEGAMLFTPQEYAHIFYEIRIPQ